MKNPPSLPRNIPLDALKGVLLLIMSVNHLAGKFPGLQPGIGHFYWTFGIFSVALGFVFLSGITTSLSLRRKAPWRFTARKLLLRVRRLYVAHVLTATVAVISIVISPQLSSDGGNFLRISENPITSWFEIVTFVYCPLLLDIIPLYCFLFVVTVAIIPLLKNRNRRCILLLFSCTLWIVARYWAPTLGPYTSNFLVFHPLAWQFLFVIGLLCGAAKNNSNTVAENTSIIRRVFTSRIFSISLFWASVFISIFFFNQRHRLIPYLTVPWSSLNGILGVRATLSPGSLINLGALSYAVWSLYSRGIFTWWAFKGPTRLLAWVGRHSLTAFTWNICLYYILSGARFEAKELSPPLQGLLLGALVVSCCIPLFLLALGKFWVSKVNFGRIELLLCAMCALIPIAYVPDFGVPYREIKNVLLWVGAASILVWSASRLSPAPKYLVERPLSFFLYCGYGVLTIKVGTLLYSQNFGEGLVQIFTLTSALILIRAAAHSSTSFERVTAWLLIPTLITTVLILYRTYFGGAVTPAGAGLGAFVGERNSSGILLAQIIPLLLIFSSQKLHSVGSHCQLHSQLYGTAIRCAAALFFGATFLASIIPRSRTAWGMITLFLFASFFFYRRTESRIWRVNFLITSCALFSTVILLTVLPTTLRWSSPTPYTESAFSLTNPIKNSNGRDELWRVGGKMLLSNPLLGVGSGNYPVVMKEYLVQSGATPKSFAFLRRDLPLFNDYLQAGAELGCIGGLLYLLFFLGTPVWLLWKQVRCGIEKNTPLMLGSLSSLAVALAGFLDYPFHRPENVTLYSILVGISLREIARSKDPHLQEGGPGIAIALRRSFLVVVGVTLFVGAISYGLSFGLRTIGYRNGDLKPLALSWSLWPWDSSWDERYGAILRQGKDERALIEYISKRLSYWPYSSTTWITLAESARANGAHTVAANAYLRALFEIPGGRCNYRARVYLERYLQQTSLPPELSHSLQLEIKKCPPL